MPHTRAKWDKSATVIRCGGNFEGRHCGRPLAVIIAGLIVVKHHGIEVVAERVHGLKCYECGTPMQIEPHAPVSCCAESAEPVSA